MKALRTSETSVLTRVIRRNIAQDGILNYTQFIERIIGIVLYKIRTIFHKWNLMCLSLSWALRHFSSLTRWHTAQLCCVRKTICAPNTTDVLRLRVQETIARNALNWQEKKGERHSTVTALKKTKVQCITGHREIFRCVKRTTGKPHTVSSLSVTFDPISLPLQRFPKSLT
jgi:hypothetical protein